MLCKKKQELKGLCVTQYKLVRINNYSINNVLELETKVQPSRNFFNVIKADCAAAVFVILNSYPTIKLQILKTNFSKCYKAFSSFVDIPGLTTIQIYLFTVFSQFTKC